MTKKWGESFLKSGLPLEHCAVVTLNSAGWACAPHQEYERQNREGKLAWFEIDLCAHKSNNFESHIELLIECKYHDKSRFWFFLPWSSSDFMAEYHATEAGENLMANSRVFNYCPFEVLVEPDLDSALKLAPMSLCLSSIARASSPDEAAKKLDWTWCYFSPRAELLMQNNALVHEIEERANLQPLKKVTSQLVNLWTAPSWFAVVNINALSTTVTTLFNHLCSLKKNSSYLEVIDEHRNRGD